MSVEDIQCVYDQILFYGRNLCVYIYVFIRVCHAHVYVPFCHSPCMGRAQLFQSGTKRWEEFKWEHELFLYALRHRFSPFECAWAKTQIPIHKLDSICHKSCCRLGGDFCCSIWNNETSLFIIQGLWDEFISEINNKSRIVWMMSPRISRVFHEVLPGKNDS